MDVRQGEVVVLIGRSGSGKSTLLNCIALLQGIDAGFIKVEGHVIASGNLETAPLAEPGAHAEVNQEVGMVFQQFNLFPHLRVLDNITLAPRRVRKISVAEAEKQARKLLNSAALAAGSIDEGQPGFRDSYGPHFFVCYLRDPQGNKIALFSNGPDEPGREG